MSLYDNTISFTASFVFLVLLTLFLRYRGIVNKSDAPLIARITVDFVLPALLVSKLIYVKVNADILWISSYILVAELLVGVCAYLIGKHLLKLPRPSLGVFILCSTFGSTAILGSAFITAIFNGDQAAVAYALVISQLSVGVPAYICFPIISMQFGDNHLRNETLFHKMRSILFSPSVMAIIFGLSWSTLDLPTQGVVITPLINAANYAGLSLILMVALLNGLTIEPIAIRDELMTIILCILFILILEPLIVFWLDEIFAISLRDRQISFILAAMPSANSIIAFAIRYKCNDKLAATFVTTTTIISAFSLPLLMSNLGIFF